MRRTPSLCGAVPVCAFLLLALPPSPASAALKLCNRTSYVLYAATGLVRVPNVTTRGWTRIVPGACETAIEGPLAPSGTYVYARTSEAHSGPAHAWGGGGQMCVMDNDFSLTAPLGANRCPSDDAFEVPFAEVATKGAKSWSATFTLSPKIASLAQAREAGIARLLADSGYKSGRNGTGQVLNKFRTRMKLPAGATAADLFDALETEALKVAAPAGYSICNDTDAAFWAALALKNGSAWVSRGWWKVTPGACARAMAAKLSTDKVYLLVERRKGGKLVSGGDVFCVTNITFETEGRENCPARGLIAAGFAPTNTRGRSGFTAHVGESGLLPPPRSPD